MEYTFDTNSKIAWIEARKYGMSYQIFSFLRLLLLNYVTMYFLKDYLDNVHSV